MRLKDGFWGKRQKTHHEVTIPHALDRLEADGHVTNFDKAAGTFDGPLCGHRAFDSDLYKALEDALYWLQHRKDDGLQKRVDGILDRRAARGGGVVLADGRQVPLTESRRANERAMSSTADASGNVTLSRWRP